MKKVVPYLTYLGLRPGEKLFEEKLMADEIKGSIHQDMHIQTQGDSSVIRKTAKKNEINVKKVDGDVWQDSEK